MTTQLVDRVLAEVESATDEIVAFAGDLVRVPTLNPPGEAYPLIYTQKQILITFSFAAKEN